METPSSMGDGGDQVWRSLCWEMYQCPGYAQNMWHACLLMINPRDLPCHKNLFWNTLMSQMCSSSKTAFEGKNSQEIYRNVICQYLYYISKLPDGTHTSHSLLYFFPTSTSFFALRYKSIGEENEVDNKRPIIISLVPFNSCVGCWGHSGDITGWFCSHQDYQKN